MPNAFLPFSAPGARLWLRSELGVGEEQAWADRLRDLPAYLASAADGRTFGQGRGVARGVELGARIGVWRHNRHGGLCGNLLGDRYWSCKRLVQEVEVSEHLREAGVQTPAILLAGATRRGLFWRLDLVTEDRSDCSTVFACAADPDRRVAALAAARRTLDRLFDLGLWATDLHPANLLFDPEMDGCWVLDLAGARLLGRPLTGAERAARIARFDRYFAKHGNARIPGR